MLDKRLGAAYIGGMRKRAAKDRLTLGPLNRKPYDLGQIGWGEKLGRCIPGPTAEMRTPPRPHFYAKKRPRPSLPTRAVASGVPHRPTGGMTTTPASFCPPLLIGHQSTATSKGGAFFIKE